MPVTSTLLANGAWSVQLSPMLPNALKDALAAGYFGHIAVSVGRADPRIAGDSLLTSARYVGVINGINFQTANGPTVSGEGMALWLATAAQVGDVIEAPLSFTAATPASVVAALLPSSVHSGTINSIGVATYTGAFVWADRRTALTSFCAQVSTGALPTQTVEWRVNGNATLDFGHVSDLYVTTPKTAIISKDAGADMLVRGLPGQTQLTEDVKDFTSRLVLLAGGTGASTAVGVANLADIGATNPYKDLFGNTIKMTRMVSASSVSSVNATASAQIALAPYATPRDQLRLTSDEYDIQGTLAVGDYTYVYDPDAGMYDVNNEITYRGNRINPAGLRVIELTWPIVTGMSVAFRDPTGKWFDLTDYVTYETGSTNVVVGGYNRQLVSTSEPVGPRPIPDSTIPATPVFGTFTTTSYQSPSDGKTKAQIQVTWATPANTDGSTVTDGDHYEIQYRPDIGIFQTNPSYNQIQSAAQTYNALNALGGNYNTLIPTSALPWKVTFVAWGTNTVLIQELTPGVTYDFQIRGVDTAAVPNRSAWSATTTFAAATDTIPPPTPDAPTVAASLVSLQVTWDCGQAGGGTFNQAVDLHHIEVHGSYDPLFTPSASTQLGNMLANVGNITGQIAVVQTFTLPPGQPPAQAMYIRVIAVDTAGNKSQPSPSAGATAVLWSNVYISDLNVSKLTAGTVSANIVLGATIGTALAGQRCVMDMTGFHAYNSDGIQIFDVTSGAAQIILGATTSGSQVTAGTTNFLSGIGFKGPTSTKKAVIYGFDIAGPDTALNIDANSFSGNGTTLSYRFSMAGASGAFLQCMDTAQGTNGGIIYTNPGGAGMGANDTAHVSRASVWTSTGGDSHVEAKNASGTVVANTEVWSSGDSHVNAKDTTSGVTVAAMDVWSTGDAHLSALVGGSRVSGLDVWGDSTITATGAFHNFASANSNDAWFSGRVVFSGFAISLGYGPTMLGQMVPIVTIGLSGAAGWSFCSGNSSTNFGVTCNVNATQAAHFFILRCP